MKRWVMGLTAAAVLAVALGGGAMGAASGREASLVSRSYLEGTFLQQVTHQASQQAQSLLEPAYQQLQETLEQSAQGYLWQYSASFSSQSGGEGERLTLGQGSGVVWRSGSAQVEGALVDLTLGAEVAQGDSLQPSHRYLAPEQVSLTLTAPSSWWVEGLWRQGDGTGLPFLDVSVSDWYYEPVHYVYEQGLYRGISATIFSPQSPMQRGMLTTVLHRLAGSPETAYAPLFTDVPEGLWYSLPTVWAGQTGVVAGLGNQVFGPEDYVSRQQIALILFRYAQYVGLDVSDRGSLDGFSDSAQVAPWAREAVSWAVSLGIIRGSDGLILPDNNASRAEVAAMVQRFADWMG